MQKRDNYYHGKTVAVYGATGGLGLHIAKKAALIGANLVIAGRNRKKLEDVNKNLSLNAEIIQADINSYSSLEVFAEKVYGKYSSVDAVINASGTDIRKSLIHYKPSEIESLISINLTANIYLTKAFLPYFLEKKQGVMLHIGGFGDGRLAFPYYSVEAAARSGLYSFIESVNREIECKKVKILYFCPAPADTDAEKPYHSLWKKMGVKIIGPKKVADEVLNAVKKRKQVSFMGLDTALGVKINLMNKKLADILFMNNYSKQIKEFINQKMEGDEK